MPFYVYETHIEGELVSHTVNGGIHDTQPDEVTLTPEEAAESGIKVSESLTLKRNKYPGGVKVKFGRGFFDTGGY